MALFAMALCCLDPALAQTVKPSFNCGHASLPSEYAICSDDHLAELDQAVSMAFRQIPATERQEGHQTQIETLEARNACGNDRLCIMDQQIAALQAFDSFGPQIPVPPWVGNYRLTLLELRGRPFVNRLPTVVGDCTKTQISAITTRFGEALKPPVSDDVDPGTAVEFVNKGYQVTYSYEPAIAQSILGDPVVLCLVSLPKDCPKGDDRGKVYSTTNLRTRASWLMADSQHMCGGA